MLKAIVFIISRFLTILVISSLSHHILSNKFLIYRTSFNINNKSSMVRSPSVNMNNTRLLNFSLQSEDTKSPSKTFLDKTIIFPVTSPSPKFSFISQVNSIQVLNKTFENIKRSRLSNSFPTYSRVINKIIKISENNSGFRPSGQFSYKFIKLSSPINSIST